MDRVWKIPFIRVNFIELTISNLRKNSFSSSNHRGKKGHPVRSYESSGAEIRMQNFKGISSPIGADCQFVSRDKSLFPYRPMRHRFPDT